MFYQFEKITPRITRIWDVSRTAMYLLEGSEKALLVDTGVGVGSLKEAVASLTDKPVSVIITHGHVDHAMGASDFDEVYLSPLDEAVYGIHSNFGMRMGYVAGAATTGADPGLLAQVKAEDYLPARDFGSYLPLIPGMKFELGGLSAEIYAAPGHTPGSVAVLIPEEELLILGDSCNAFTFLFDGFAPTVAQYRETLLRLLEESAGKYSRCLFSHGIGEGCADMIDNVIAVCDDILSGKSDCVPFMGFGGEKAFIAKAMDFGRFCRADGGEGNVIYDPSKIR